MAAREAKQARGSAWGAWDWRMRRVRDTDGAWRRVECVLMWPKLQPARGGECDVVSGLSWLGFARNWLFCHFMPLLWQLDEQNDDIRELQGLWA